jgi:hypothetical protein
MTLSTMLPGASRHSLALALLLIGAVALSACSKSSAGTDAGVRADAAQVPPDAAAILDAAAVVADASPSEPDAAATVDAGEDASVSADASAPTRTMIERPLFGDTHPQNLLIDPSFSVRYGGGLGNWMAATADESQGTATFSGSLLSDSPAGIAMNTARLSDARGSTGNFELDLLAQVPGGPGPYHLRVWVSTLDAKASASLTGITAGLITSLDATDVIEVTEDPAKAQDLAGRTWHLFTGQIDQPLSVGGFFLLDFPATTNTWLLQSPEFIPVALDHSPTQEKLQHRPPSAPRPATAHEKDLVRRYRLQPKISVPAGHRAITEQPRDLHR